MILQINKPRVVTSSISSSRSAGVVVGTIPTPPQSSKVPTQQIVYKRYHIQTPQTVWVVNHNQNTDRFVVVLRDEHGELFDAKIVRINDKTIEVQLATALAGYVDLIFDISTNPVIAI